jgi:hypothetical protein
MVHHFGSPYRRNNKNIQTIVAEFERYYFDSAEGHPVDLGDTKTFLCHKQEQETVA